MQFEEHTSEVEGIKVPRFLLLTVVENSYKYALGTSEVMQILMQCKRLYEEGYYLSPDLYRSYFPAPVEAVILGWIGVIGWNLVRRCFKRRQKEKKGSSDYVLH